MRTFLWTVGWTGSAPWERGSMPVCVCVGMRGAGWRGWSDQSRFRPDLPYSCLLPVLSAPLWKRQVFSSHDVLHCWVPHQHPLPPRPWLVTFSGLAYLRVSSQTRSVLVFLLFFSSNLNFNKKKGKRSMVLSCLRLSPESEFQWVLGRHSQSGPSPPLFPVLSVGLWGDECLGSEPSVGHPHLVSTGASAF